ETRDAEETALIVPHAQTATSVARSRRLAEKDAPCGQAASGPPGSSHGRAALAIFITNTWVLNDDGAVPPGGDGDHRAFRSGCNADFGGRALVAAEGQHQAAPRRRI